MQQKNIDEIMSEIKSLINEAGSQGYKINKIEPKRFIGTSTCNGFSWTTNIVNFDIDYGH